MHAGVAVPMHELPWLRRRLAVRRFRRVHRQRPVDGLLAIDTGVAPCGSRATRACQEREQTATSRPWPPAVIARPGSTLRVLVALVVLSASFVAVHVTGVRERAYEYRRSASAAAPKVHFAGRDHLRVRQVADLPSGEVLLGRTEGSGLVSGPHGADPYVPTVVRVRAGGGHVFGDALSGGS